MERIILIANEGKIYTNGTTYGVEVYLATDDSPANWYEVDYEEYLKEQEALLEDVLP